MEETTITSLEDQIFELHYCYYRSIGIETIKQQAGQIEQVSSDYQGRVIYELLQNAFDKAHNHILVMVRGNAMYVANDGEQFSYVAGFDYERGQSKRGDFQSLCSISTSTKNVDTSIGNKGIGFKSVFSISESGFVYVFTKGLIILGDKEIPEKISFRVHDSFKKPEQIPTDFEPELQNAILEKMLLVQQERNDRGIPGYYFPFHIKSEDDEIIELFNKGFVTVIKIPFTEKEVIKDLFEEIKQVHFQFIQLKQEKDFEIEFRFDDESHIQNVIIASPRMFSVSLDNDEIRELAREADFNIENPKVAIYLRENENGYMYNYLPTKVRSPFKYVDFHADFRTTIDRKSINFDGKVGRYNRALFRACIELYFQVLNSYLDIPVELNCCFIDPKSIVNKLKDFSWNLIDLQETASASEFIIQTLKISDWYYDLASDFLARIAKKFFEPEREEKDYYAFHENVSFFIESFTNDHKKQYKRSQIFKRNLGTHLLEKNAKVIPGVDSTRDQEVIFRKTNEKSAAVIELPDFIGIIITEFVIEDEYFRREALGIKDFTDYNEIAKYFKQCSFSGKVGKESLSEEQQIELIKSLYQIYDAKNDRSFLITHRFTKAWSPKLRENNSTLNQANFNISTIFFKTTEKKYKPAQLCTLEELDTEFLDLAIPSENRLDFLRFLGVSTDTRYLFADIRLFSALKNGLDYIPTLADRKEDKIDEELISSLYVITPKGKMVHPALINDNNYSFLENAFTHQIRPELENLLVKRYNDFPSSFREILKERLNSKFIHRNDVIRLYQNIFHLFEKDGLFLVTEGKGLSWTKSVDFTILTTKADFDLIANQESMKILCYYSGSDIPEYLKPNIVTPQKGDITYDQLKKNDELKRVLEERMIILLIKISHSKDSQQNYLKDDVDLYSIQHRMNLLDVYEVQNLSQEVRFRDIVINKPGTFAIDDQIEGRVFIRNDASETDRASCISEYLFNNATIRELVELVVFRQESEKIRNGIDNVEFEIISKKWKADYSTKFREFESEILAHFGYDASDHDTWNIYRNNNISIILIELDKQGKLNELKHLVNLVKSRPEYEGYFDNFDLEIDRSEIENLAGRLISFFQQDENEQNAGLIERVKSLSFQLGSENELLTIEKELEQRSPGYKTFASPILEQVTKTIGIDSRIHEIFSKMGKSSTKEITILEHDGAHAATRPISVSAKKLIFQNNGTGAGMGAKLEATGASGEEEVLICYISAFLDLPVEERIIGIKAVYDEIRVRTGNNLLEEYKNKCLEVVDKDEELKKALIPLFYITMHYKYSYFDLIAYSNGNPVLVEVKTTTGTNNHRFFLSIAEVNAARMSEYYELVRVSPDSITFMGNPIKSMEGKIEEVNRGMFSMIPRNYEFRFNLHD